jgi:tetratricopeptide (TPR) repeat protein
MSLYYLALCFKEKQQYDLAMEQLKTASEEILIMDSTKKAVLYAQGEIAELMGDQKLASEFYKEIYQSDISYKDVAQKIEQAYSS